jgi:hypothetical protein
MRQQSDADRPASEKAALAVIVADRLEKVIAGARNPRLNCEMIDLIPGKPEMGIQRIAASQPRRTI